MKTKEIKPKVNVLTKIELDAIISEMPNRKLLGRVDGELIYLSKPSFDCGWYWGFGYLGNRNCHYHVDGLMDKHNTNLFDAFKAEFGDSLVISDVDLWVISELFMTFYTLKSTAEVLGRGGSHMTTNPLSKLIINKNEVKRINEVLLPHVFVEIYKILDKY